MKVTQANKNSKDDHIPVNTINVQGHVIAYWHSLFSSTEFTHQRFPSKSCLILADLGNKPFNFWCIQEVLNYSTLRAIEKPRSTPFNLISSCNHIARLCSKKN